MDSDGTMQLQESFPFGDDRKLFDSTLKYIHSRKTSLWSNKIFKANIFVIHKVLPIFTKILSHGNLEPYGILQLYISIRVRSTIPIAVLDFHAATKVVSDI